jgi:hypothetical protein
VKNSVNALQAYSMHLWEFFSEVRTRQIGGREASAIDASYTPVVGRTTGGKYLKLGTLCHRAIKQPCAQQALLHRSLSCLRLGCVSGGIQVEDRKDRALKSDLIRYLVLGGQQIGSIFQEVTHAFEPESDELEQS